MTEERIIAYLLKELPDEELERFEDECFEQEKWPVEVELVEEDLIDAYLLDELRGEQRERFEQNYLITPARQERVRMAAAILRRLDEANAGVEKADATTAAVVASQTSVKTTLGERLRAFWTGWTPAFRIGLAVVVAAVIAGSLWLYLSRNRSPRTFATLTLNISRSNRAEGAQAERVKLPLDADALRITLTIPDQSPAAVSYHVGLENVEKDEGIKPLDVVQQNAQTVTVVVPASQLTRSQFALKLFAVKSDGSEQRLAGNYFFNVE